MLSLLLLTGCTQNKEIQYCEVFPFNNGHAFLVQDNLAFTALHCCQEQDNILYSNPEMDFAVISTPLVFTDSKIQISSVFTDTNLFTDTSYLVRPGDSGSPFIEDSVLKGVYIGNTDGQSLISPVPKEALKYLTGKEK